MKKGKRWEKRCESQRKTKKSRSKVLMSTWNSLRRFVKYYER